MSSQSMASMSRPSGSFSPRPEESPLDRHLYAASFREAGDPRRLTEEPGVHSVHVAPRGQGWVDVHSAIDRAPRAVVHDSKNGAAGELPCPLDDDFASLRLRAPELVTVRGPSGDVLHGALLQPRQTVPGKRYPAVVMVYGGPGHQAVQNQLAARLMWQHLADRGVAVFQLDNRGTPGGGGLSSKRPMGAWASSSWPTSLPVSNTSPRCRSSMPLASASTVTVMGDSWLRWRCCGRRNIFGWGSPDRRSSIGALRHWLHRAVHGRSARQPERLRRRRVGRACSQLAGEALSPTRAHERKCPFSEHRASHRSPNCRRQTVRPSRVSRRAPRLSKSDRQRVRGQASGRVSSPPPLSSAFPRHVRWRFATCPETHSCSALSVTRAPRLGQSTANRSLRAMPKPWPEPCSSLART